MDYKKLFILFLFFICPVLIYSLITELRFEYGKWIVIILWFSFLGTIYYYRSKIYEKNCLIKELNERFDLDDKLKSTHKKGDHYDFTINRLRNGIKDATESK